MSLKDLITSDVENVFLSEEDFAECVTFKDFGDQTLSGRDFKTFKVLVELDEPIRDDRGTSPTLYTGRLRFPANKRTQILSDSKPALTVMVRGYEWDITDVGEDSFGFCNIGIRRENPEHSNAIDLKGNQHRYG